MERLVVVPFHGAVRFRDASLWPGMAGLGTVRRGAVGQGKGSLLQITREEVPDGRYEATPT